MIYFVKHSKMHSEDVRWQIVSLIHTCDLDLSFVRELVGPNTSSARRWCTRFISYSSTRDEEIVLYES